MTSPKLKKVLDIICRRLESEHIFHALIGAGALALYGMPRFTADIDLLAEQQKHGSIRKIMNELGFDCFQDTETFAQFDSELGVYGKVDFMFVQTDDGMAVLERAVHVTDAFWGNITVVQPTDYAVLKLMAIANNPERKAHDTADLETLFRAAAAGFMDFHTFTPIDAERLKAFAEKFDIKAHLECLLPLLENNAQHL